MMTTKTIIEKTFTQEEQETIETAIFIYRRKLKKALRQQRAFSQKLQELGLYAHQEGDVKQEIEYLGVQDMLCERVLEKL